MDKEERIRRRAYELWYLRGCPSGHDQAHWRQACQEIEGRQGIQHPSDAQDRYKDNVAEGGDQSLGNVERKDGWQGAE